MANICVFGDSIAWGAFDNKKGGWVERLKTSLFDKEIIVYNCGVSRDNTKKLLNRFEIEAISREPNIILFAIGANDSQYVNSKDNPRIELSEFKDNLQKLIDKAKKLTDKIIFVGLIKVDESKTMPIPWNIEKFYDNENISKYDSEIKNICKKNNLLYINLFDVIDVKDLPDGLHPNEKGHEKMFQVIKKEIESLI